MAMVPGAGWADDAFDRLDEALSRFERHFYVALAIQTVVEAATLVSIIRLT